MKAMPALPLRIGAALAAACALPAWSLAQQTDRKENAADASADEVIVLSPFVVTANSDVGYAARETLGGGRFRTDYKDVSSQVNVMTAEFLRDIAAATLEESFRHSMNVESESAYFSVASGSATDTGNPTSPTGGNRTRGLTRSSITHDFFESYVPVDGYNTDRYTFISGANAILFGNGQAGGAIEAGFSRADPRRQFGRVESRFNDDGGWRSSINVNQPLLDKKVAVRFAAMRGDEDPVRKPSFTKSHREYLALTLEPVKWARLYAYYEQSDIRKALTRPILAQDKVTPWLNSLPEATRNSWLASGDASLLPGLNNAAINSTASSANQTALRNALTAQGFSARNGNTTFGNFSASADSRLQAILGAGGLSTVPVQSWYATAISEGPEQFYNLAEIGNDWSISNPSIYPRMLNINGNGGQNHMTGDIRGVIAEFNPIKNLTVEVAANKETFDQPYVDWLPYASAELHIDVNRYLPAIWTGSTVPTRTLNPNFGRYYIAASPGAGAVANLKDERRATALYFLDFTARPGWAKHFGKHYLSVGWSRQINEKYETVSGGPRIVSDHSFTTAAASVDLNNANRQFSYRYYIDSPSANPAGNAVLNLPFDPWNPGSIGVDATGKSIEVATNELPYGPSTYSSPVRNGRKKSEGVIASMQNTLLQGRLVTTFGVRKDDNEFTNWTANTLQPRWDGANNAWFYPTAANPLPTRLTNAPYMAWRDFRNSPDENRLGTKLVENGKYSRLTGVVVHPAKWLSLSYNKANTSYATDYTRKGMEGAPPQLDDGDTKDYGIILSSPDGKYTLRAVRYESNLLGRSSSYRDTGVGSPNGRGIRDLIPYVERSYQIATGTKPGADFKQHFYTDDVAIATIPSWSGALGSTPSAFGGPRDDYDVLANRSSKGYEVTFTANPKKGFRVSLTGAKNSTTETGIGKMYFDFVDARLKDWEKAPDAPIIVNSTTGLINSAYTIRTFMRDWVVPQLNFLQMVEGLTNPSERKYRFNFTTRYGFGEGFLKGTFVGASSIYRSRGAIGTSYRAATAEDIAYNFLNVATPQTTLVPDYGNLLYAPSTITWDAFAGYERKLFKGRINWRVQLNVRNALDNRKLIPLRAQLINGTQFNYAFNTADPRQFLLTNSFSF